MNAAIDRLMRRQVELERRMNQRTPQLDHSSIEGGAVVVNDAAGNVRGYIGRQPDGTYGSSPVSGPVPPIPTAPILTPVVGGLVVRWDGEFINAAAAPMDLSYIEVHVSLDPDWHNVEQVGPDAPTLHGTISTARSCDAYIAALGAGPHFVWLFSRSTAGKYSILSDSSTASPIDLDDAIATLVADSASATRAAITALP